jgi:nitrite reductase/ring-hydroxylating ferredoxin subunit
VTWRSTGVSAETLREGLPRELVPGARTIVLARAVGAVHALDGICPHLGGLLGDGTLEGERLACPLHGATFNVTNGTVLVDPFGVEPPEGGAERLRTYPTRVDGAGLIEVDLPDEGSG